MDEPHVFGEVIVEASVAEAYAAWTTEAGIKTFFAPACHVVLQPDQPYEIYFFPDNEPGLKGAEGTRVLAFQPLKMLAFTWDAPPNLPEVRKQRTRVLVRFYPVDEEHTRVTLRHDGWGEGGEWDQARQYFETAWNETVLPRMAYRFRHGPIDWNHVPEDYSV